MTKPALQAVAETADAAKTAELRRNVVEAVAHAGDALRNVLFGRGRKTSASRKLAHGAESQLIIALYARTAAYLALQPRPEEGIAVAMTSAQIAQHAEELIGEVFAYKLSRESVSDFAYHWRLAIADGFTHRLRLRDGTRWRVHLHFSSGNDRSLLSFDIEREERIGMRTHVTPASTVLPTRPAVPLVDICRATAIDPDGQHALNLALSAIRRAADRGNRNARRLRDFAKGIGLLLVTVAILAMLFPKDAGAAFQRVKRFVERWFTRENAAPPDPRFRGQLRHHFYNGRAPDEVRRQGAATILIWHLTPTRWHFAIDTSLPPTTGYAIAWEWTFSVAGETSSIERSGVPEITHTFPRAMPIPSWSMAVRPLPYIQTAEHVELDGGYLYVLDERGRRVSPGTHEYVSDIAAADGTVFRRRYTVRDAGRNRSTVTRDFSRADGTLIGELTDDDLFPRERAERYGRLRFPTPGPPALLAMHWYVDRQWITFVVSTAVPISREESLHLYFGDGTLPATNFEDATLSRKAIAAHLHGNGQFLLLEHHYDGDGPFTATVLAINNRTGSERILDQILVHPSEEPPTFEWWIRPPGPKQRIRPLTFERARSGAVGVPDGVLRMPYVYADRMRNSDGSVQVIFVAAGAAQASPTAAEIDFGDGSPPVRVTRGEVLSTPRGLLTIFLADHRYASHSLSRRITARLVDTTSGGLPGLAAEPAHFTFDDTQ
jgi:hypothetical protein